MLAPEAAGAAFDAADDSDGTAEAVGVDAGRVRSG